MPPGSLRARGPLTRVSGDDLRLEWVVGYWPASPSQRALPNQTIFFQTVLLRDAKLGPRVLGAPWTTCWWRRLAQADSSPRTFLAECRISVQIPVGRRCGRSSPAARETTAMTRRAGLSNRDRPPRRKQRIFQRRVPRTLGQTDGCPWTVLLSPCLLGALTPFVMLFRSYGRAVSRTSFLQRNARLVAHPCRGKYRCSGAWLSNPACHHLLPPRFSALCSFLPPRIHIRATIVVYYEQILGHRE
jgi:hypothetical protein